MAPLPASVRVNAQFPFPSLVTASGGLSVSKSGGIWNIAPNFSALAAITTVSNPTSEQVWVFNPLTNVYNVMTLSALGLSLFNDTSGTSATIGTGQFTFTVTPGKMWSVGSWIMVASAANPTVNYMIGQVMSYGTSGGSTSLMLNVLAIGGSGTHSDWVLSLTGQPSQAQGFSAIEFIFDGGGQALTPGTEGYLQIPFGCQILNSNLFADQVGSLVLDVRKSSYAGYPPSGANSIVATDPPTLTAQQKSTDSLLTSWTTAIVPNDILVWHIVSNSGAITRVTHSMAVQRT